MRSRLPGKLRSSSRLLGAVIVKNRTGLAKRWLIIGRLASQILRDADQSPRQHQAKAEKQEQSDRNIHGYSPAAEFSMRDYKMRSFSAL